MKPREGLLVLLVVAAAFAAAFSVDVAMGPRALHRPVHAERFEEVREQLPALGAVRVRSETPQAAQRLATAKGGGFLRVLDPNNAATSSRFGRLLYATPAEVDDVLAHLERGEVPPALPAAPDVAGYFRDRRGPYACDVIVRGPGDVDRILDVLPDARLGGEPVVRRAEQRAARNLPRALIVALVAVCALAAWREGVLAMERRLLAALVPLAALGLLGWGLDPWTVMAIAVVAGAPHGLPLLSAAPCLLFPSRALLRIGLVLLLGGLLRWGLPEARRYDRGRRGAVVLVLLVAAGAGALLPLPVRARVPPALELEPAVQLVDRAGAAATVRALEAEGFEYVIGGTGPPTPRADLATRRRFHRIFQLANGLARSAPEEQRERFSEVADAAALEEFHLPAELRMRLRALDGRAAIWVQDEIPEGRDEFTGAGLHRVRGERGMRRDARAATCLAFALFGLLAWRRRGNRAVRPLVGRFAGIAAGSALLFFADAWSALPAEVGAPLLVVAASAPALAPALGVAASAVVAPDMYLSAAGALLLAAGGAWLGERRPNRRRR